MPRMQLVAVVVAALAFMLLGPRLVGPQPKSAGAPFEYRPPTGFARDASSKTPDATLWVEANKESVRLPARVALHHSATEMSVDEAELGKLAADMPKVFSEGDGACAWVHLRHEMRMRPDGARVGLIEGDCTAKVDLKGAFGMPAQSLKMRKLQLVFPDDTGTSIVTASFPPEEASRWEPAFEESIANATGVATRVPAQPTWVYAAWAAAGAVLGWLASALFLRGSRGARESDDAKHEAKKERA